MLPGTPNGIGRLRLLDCHGTRTAERSAGTGSCVASEFGDGAMRGAVDVGAAFSVVSFFTFSAFGLSGLAVAADLTGATVCSDSC